jgi:hypothetical protein
VVEAHLLAKDESPRSQVALELSEAKAENKKLTDELRRKNLILENHEKELYKLRHAAFVDADEHKGLRRFDERLPELLQKSGNKGLSGFAILDKLEVDPKDTESVKIVENQLGTLRGFGLVEEVNGYWGGSDEYKGKRYYRSKKDFCQANRRVQNRL